MHFSTRLVKMFVMNESHLHIDYRSYFLYIAAAAVGLDCHYM